MSNQIENALSKFETLQVDRVYDLTKFSHARVGLGHTGGHLKLRDWLDLQAGFAEAKDAVFSHFAISKLEKLCDNLNLVSIQIDSQITEPTQFLLRPDLGRLLLNESAEKLSTYVNQHPESLESDLLIVDLWWPLPHRHRAAITLLFANFS